MCVLGACVIRGAAGGPSAQAYAPPTVLGPPVQPPSYYPPIGSASAAPPQASAPPLIAPVYSPFTQVRISPQARSVLRFFCPQGDQGCWLTRAAGGLRCAGPHAADAGLGRAGAAARRALLLPAGAATGAGRGRPLGAARALQGRLRAAHGAPGPVQLMRDGLGAASLCVWRRLAAVANLLGLSSSWPSPMQLGAPFLFLSLRRPCISSAVC